MTQEGYKLKATVLVPVEVDLELCRESWAGRKLEDIRGDLIEGVLADAASQLGLDKLPDGHTLKAITVNGDYVPWQYGNGRTKLL